MGQRSKNLVGQKGQKWKEGNRTIKLKFENLKSDAILTNKRGQFYSTTTK